MAAFDAVKTIVVEEQSKPEQALNHSWYRRRLEVRHRDDEELAAISATNEREQDEEREEKSTFSWSGERSSFATSTLVQGEGLDKPIAEPGQSAHSVVPQTESLASDKVKEERSKTASSSTATGFASSAIFGSQS